MMSNLDTSRKGVAVGPLLAKNAMLVMLVSLSICIFVYASRAAVGNLYVLSLKDEIEAVATLNSKGEIPSIVDARQLTASVMSWDGHTPSTLAYVASFTRWFEHLLSQSHVYQQNSLSIDVPMMLDEAIEARPTMSNQYLLRAMELWLEGESKEVIAHQYQLAQHFGPFDKDVALASLEFYLAYWPSLTKQEKVLASRYLLSPRDYRLNYWQIGAVIKRSQNQKRACNLLRFNNVHIRECKV
ncbi:hypothetical protein F0231_09160 [Vibrio sp. RE86]|uniref:hypothetical protein n=1 Tax=Vibrio sp. RE86 TaxID=2607605 RepID=UPI001493510E|nr:hypothetical protein [Vibrio sp. RE86]NOH79912.1 hypothetical protein [Vibrio sp. RE86]